MPDLLVPRNPLTSALVAALLLVPAAGAAGDDRPGAKPEAGALSVESIWKGKSLLAPLPRIVGWRTGTDAWLEWRQDLGPDGKPVEDPKAPLALFEVDAATGRSMRVLSLADLSNAGGRKPRDDMAVKGVGRAGPPELLWSDDGRTLVLPFKGDLYRFDFTAGKKQRLTETRSPIGDVRISPDGQKASFTRDHELFAVVVTEDRVREIQLTSGGNEDILHGELDWVYPEELGCRTAAWWSPDSTRVAFLKLDETRVPKSAVADPAPLHGSVRWQRYPKAGEPNPVPSVGIVGLEGSPPVFVDLGNVGGSDPPEIYVPWVFWWPDSSKVGVAVLDRAQTRFEIRAFAAGGGAGSSSWTEEDPRWVSMPPPPHVLKKAPAILLKSRRDGFWRLWRVPLDGGEPKALTAPKKEIGRLLAVDEDAGTFFFEGPSDDGLRTLVFRGTLDGSKEGVTPESDAAWNHSTSFSTTGRVHVDTLSKATIPPRMEVRGADFATLRPLADSKTPAWAALSLVEPEFTRVKGPEGTDFPAVLWRPKEFPGSKKWAVLVDVYGGPGSRMVRDDFSEKGLLWRTLLAREGIVTFSLDGRGTGGRGKDFEHLVHKRLGQLETEDQVRGAQWLKARKGIDGARIAISGWSYGGFMAAYAMTKAADAFAAGIAGAPVTDWRLYDTIYTERYMGLPSENAAGYDASAPLGFAKDVKGPLLLLHGLLDDNVHLQNTVRMSDALIRAGKDFEQFLYPGAGHGVGGPDPSVDLHRRMLDFLKRRLRLPAK